MDVLPDLGALLLVAVAFTALYLLLEAFDRV
jgi:hypothetical protein